MIAKKAFEAEVQIEKLVNGIGRRQPDAWREGNENPGKAALIRRDGIVCRKAQPWERHGQ